MESTYLVKDFMVTSLITLSPDLDIYSAVDVLVKEKVAGAPVVDRLGKLVGIISDRDCLRATLAAGMHESPPGTVADYMSRQVMTIESSMGIFHVAKMFLDHGYRRFPVVENGRLLGQVSRRDVLTAVRQVRQEHR